MQLTTRTSSTTTTQTSSAVTAPSSATGIASTPPKTSGTPSNITPTTAAAAAVAVISVCLTIGAAVGFFQRNDDAAKPNQETNKSSSAHDDKKSHNDNSVAAKKPLPLNSFVQEANFWEQRVKQREQKEQQQQQAFNKASNGSYWKDGLLYNHPSQDEPSSCALCNMFRNGPCRPYQRAVEHCLDHQQQADNNDEIEQGHDNEPTKGGMGRSSSMQACQPQLDRLFQECLVYHSGLYRLIDNFIFQDQIDEHEWRERMAQDKVYGIQTEPQPMTVTQVHQIESYLIDRASWSQHLQIDWSHWQAFVKENGWTTSQVRDMLQQQQDDILSRAQKDSGIAFGPSWWKDRPVTLVNVMEQVLDPSRNADFSTLLPSSSSSSAAPPPQSKQEDDQQLRSSSSESTVPFWKFLEDDPDPILIPLSVTCPSVDPKTGYPLLAAYVRDDATGRVLGHATAAPPSYASSSSSAMTTTTDSNASSAKTGENGEAATGRSGDEASESIQQLQQKQELSVSQPIQPVDFCIVPGWTESIRVYAVYQKSDQTFTEEDNEDDFLPVVFRESPPMSLVDALSSDYQWLEHDPDRLAERLRLIRNYTEWSSLSHQAHHHHRLDGNVENF